MFAFAFAEDSVVLLFAVASEKAEETQLLLFIEMSAEAELDAPTICSVKVL